MVNAVIPCYSFFPYDARFSGNWNDFLGYSLSWNVIKATIKNQDTVEGLFRYVITYVNKKPNTVWCRYNTVNYFMILHIILQTQQQNINQTLNSQKIPHTSPSWARYGVSIIRILEKFDRVITASRSMSSRVTIMGNAFCQTKDPFSIHKDQWRGVLMFSLKFAWTNGWANNRHACDLRRHCDHYDVTVMGSTIISTSIVYPRRHQFNDCPVTNGMFHYISILLYCVCFTVIALSVPDRTA